MGLDLLLDAPFYTGAGLGDAAEVPWRTQVAIGTHVYPIDPAKYRRTSIESRRTPQDQSIEPGEQSLNTEGLWRRSMDNWFMGAGQLYADNRFGMQTLYVRTGELPSLRTRFYRSKGVNPWGEGALSLHNECDRKLVSANTNLDLLAVGSNFYAADGNNIRFTADPTAAPATWTTVTGTPATPVLSITTDGNTVWAAYGANIYSTTSGAAAAAALGAYVPTRVWFANGRLLAANANVLTEISRAGASAVITNNPTDTNWVWTAVASAPNAIYAAGYSGDRGAIYSIGVNTTTTALAPMVWAAGLPPGETPQSLRFSNGGWLVIGTSLGVRVADITANNFLNYGPVIDAPGAVGALTTYGRFVYFSWTNYTDTDVADDSTSVSVSGLGRLDPSQTPQPLQPAYATDVLATDGVNGTVTGVAVFNGKRYFAVSGSGIWGENAKKVTRGWLKSGWIRYGTTEPKVVSTVDVRHDALAGSVDLYLKNEAGTVTLLGSSSTAASTGPPSLVGAGGTVGEAFMFNVALNRSATDTTTGPTLRRWTVRALVTPANADEIIVPLIVRSVDESIAGEGEDLWYDTLAEFQYLTGLKSAGTIVRYQEGTSSYSVYIDRVEVQPEKWNGDRTFFDGLIVCRLVTVAS